MNSTEVNQIEIAEKDLPPLIARLEEILREMPA